MDYDKSDRFFDPVDDRVVFYIDDLAVQNGQEIYNYNSPPVDFHPGNQEIRGLYPLESQSRPSRSCSVYSQPGRSRRSRIIQVDTEGNVANRRASIHGGRVRANSCNGPTPLGESYSVVGLGVIQAEENLYDKKRCSGDGRRASVCRKNRPKRASTIRRKGSIRSGNSAAIYTEGIEGSGKEVEELPPMSLVEIAQDRSRRKIVTIVLIIFIFLLVASILIVVITLTHSTFHSLPNEGANSVIEEPQILQENQLRRENEELLNSLSRDSFVPDNITELST